MIDLVVRNVRKSRAEELSAKYKQFPARKVNVDLDTINVLRDISLTLGLICDELRGVKDDT